MLEQSASANPIVKSTKSDIDGAQRYYWTRQWQDAEKEARTHIQAGRITKLNELNDIESHFNILSKPSQQIAGQACVSA